MRTTHHHSYTCCPDSVSHSVRFCRHTGHGTDTDKCDSVFLYELNELALVHRLRISVHQEHFMSWRRNCLKQKHPEVRHKIACDAIVWIIKEDFHGSVS